ncbi:hypothetical protein U1Q18_048608 [Sarracenia purpurea var. burkii]
MVLLWGTECRRFDKIRKCNCGGTAPDTFLEYISDNFNRSSKLELHVTTDGEIEDLEILNCATYVNQPNFPRLDRVTIHYIGTESEMNFGLNAIFGSVSDLSFTINDIKNLKTVPSPRQLETYDDIFTEDFLAFLCTRVTVLKRDNFNEFNRLRKHLIAKIEQKKNETNKPIQPLEYFEKATPPIWKNKILKCFDTCSDIKISDIRARANLQNNVLTEPNVVAGYELTEDIVVEDCISFENIDEGKVCVLVKFDEQPLFKSDSKYVKNPLLIFQDESVRTKVIKRFEFQPFSISSVKQLTEQPDAGNNIRSPFTRDICRAFILGPSNMNEVNFNSHALTSFFKSEQRDKIYGNKLLWNLVVLYLIKTHIDSSIERDESVAWARDELHPLVNSILKEFVMNDKLLYLLTLHVKINLPVERVPLYLALWYIVCVVPFNSPNTTRNILRYPGASILLKLYDDVHLEDATGKILLSYCQKTKLHVKIKMWRLYNEMLARRKDKELILTTRAAYQNYCMVENKVVLLSGARPHTLKAPDLVSDIPPAIVKDMWKSIKPRSSRFDKINENEERMQIPKPVELRHDKNEWQAVYHIEIDPETLRPTEICPVTKRPSIECAGRFDVKSESYARIFSLYCAKYKKYPQNPDQLVLLHNRRRAIGNVSSKYIANYMKHVFEIYQPFTENISCNDFVEKYNAAAKKEQKGEVVKNRHEESERDESAEPKPQRDKKKYDRRSERNESLEPKPQRDKKKYDGRSERDQSLEPKPQRDRKKYNGSKTDEPLEPKPQRDKKKREERSERDKPLESERKKHRKN